MADDLEPRVLAFDAGIGKCHKILEEVPRQVSQQSTLTAIDEDSSGPLSPVLQVPDHGALKPKNGSGRLNSTTDSNELAGASVDQENLHEEFSLRRALAESEARFERRLQKMALLHAKTTQQLLCLQTKTHQAAIRFIRTENDIAAANLRHDLVLKQAEVDAMAEAFELEVQAWAARACSSESREAAVLSDRARLTAQLRWMQIRVDEAEHRKVAGIEQTKRDGRAKLDQLVHLLIAHNKA